MLKQFGDNVFQGWIIEVYIGILLVDQVFIFIDWIVEMKVKVFVCIFDDVILIGFLELVKGWIQIMIDKGMDNDVQVLQGLIDKVNKCIVEIMLGEKLVLMLDVDVKYFVEVVVDFDQIDELMIVDLDVDNVDIFKCYMYDIIWLVFYYGVEKKVDFGFVGFCMVYKGDIKIVVQMLKNLEKVKGKVEFQVLFVVVVLIYNIIDELKEEGDWEMLEKYFGFEFDDMVLK